MHPPPRLFIGVVSQAHVLRGVAGGFAQVCHGKRSPLARMRAGDWLAYYSPTTVMGGGEKLQAFTALGQVADDEVFPFDMGGGFVPWRRRVAYLPAARVAPLAGLKARLSFTAPGRNFGLLARRGHFEAAPEDLEVLAEGLGVRLASPAMLRGAPGQAALALAPYPASP